MRKYPDSLIYSLWRDHSTTFIFIFLCLISIIAVTYITVVDVRLLLVFVNQTNTPGLTNEMRTYLEWEIAAEAIKVFLDIYLFGVILMIITPSLYTLVTKRDMFGINTSLELGAKLFFCRVDEMKKWLIGIVLLRMIIRYFQKLLRMDAGGEADIVYLTIIIFLIFTTFLLSHDQSK